MYLKLAIVVGFLLANVHGLTCTQGGAGNALTLDFSFYNETECPDDGVGQFCLRGEGVFEAFGYIEVNATLAICANASTCAEDCGKLALRLIKQGDELGIKLNGFDLSMLQAEPLECIKACCNTSNCNAGTVEEILAGPQRFSPTAEPTAPPPPQVSSCAVGYQIPLQGEQSWEIDSCPMFPGSACLRQDVLLVLDDGRAGSFTTGQCSNQSTCSDSCSMLASSFITTGLESGINFGFKSTDNYKLTSCRIACCDENQCTAEEDTFSETVEEDVEDVKDLDPDGKADKLSNHKSIVLLLGLVSYGFGHLLS